MNSTTTLHHTASVFRSENSRHRLLELEKTFADITTIGLLSCDLNGQCFYYNKYITELLKIKHFEDTLTNFTSSIYLEDQAKFFEIWNKVKTSQRPYKLQFRLKNSHHSPIRANCELLPLVNAKNEVETILGIIIDNSRLYRAEEFVRLHHWKLDKFENYYQQDETLASITHELTQPMSVISIYTQRSMARLKELNIDDEVLTVAMGKIKTLVDRSTRILNDIRGFYHTEEIHASRTNFDELIQHAFEALNGHVLDSMNIKRDLQKPPQSLQVDDFQIQQVILNLTKNACDAMSKINPKHRYLMFKSYTDGDWVYLSISDSGPGIPIEIQENIFKPFTTSKKHGMGMGLAISRSICQAHGGELLLEQTSGEGTTFVIKLPKSQK